MTTETSKTTSKTTGRKREPRPRDFPSHRPLSREVIAMLEAIGECLTVPWPADWGADRDKRLELIESRASRLRGALSGLEHGSCSAGSVTRPARGITEHAPVNHAAETPELAAGKDALLQRYLAQMPER